MFKPGDQVKYKTGGTFSNGKSIVTVDRIVNEYGEIHIWLKETKSWVMPDSIELVVPTHAQLVKQQVKAIVDKKQKEIKDLEDDVKKLNYVLATLEELDV